MGTNKNGVAQGKKKLAQAQSGVKQRGEAGKLAPNPNYSNKRYYLFLLLVLMLVLLLVGGVFLLRGYLRQAEASKLILTRWSNYGEIADLKVWEYSLDGQGNLTLRLYPSDVLRDNGINFARDKAALLSQQKVKLAPESYSMLNELYQKLDFAAWPEDCGSEGLDGHQFYLGREAAGKSEFKGGFVADYEGPDSFRELAKAFQELIDRVEWN